MWDELAMSGSGQGGGWPSWPRAVHLSLWGSGVGMLGGTPERLQQVCQACSKKLQHSLT